MFKLKIGLGYNYQYSRNNLQFNRRNGHVQRSGTVFRRSGDRLVLVPLWLDFDNDGLKDLFISNGIPQTGSTISTISTLSPTTNCRKRCKRKAPDKTI